MVNEKASKWVIGIVVYFILLSSIFVVASSITSEYGLNETSNLSTSGGGSYDFGDLGACDNPRLDVTGAWYKAEVVQKIYNPKYSVLTKAELIEDNETCLSYSGAVWEEKTFLWFFGTGTFTCTGIINQTYYNGGENYSEENYLGLWDKTVCGLSDLQNNRQTCESFGCTYYSGIDADMGVSENANGVAGVFKSIGDIVSFKILFDTTNTLLNLLLAFFFIWLPLIGLILASYELVRG